MRDELEDIKHILRHAPELKPDPAARQAAISLALKQFDKKNSAVSQGNRMSSRLKDTADAVGHFIFGSTPMKKNQLIIIAGFFALFVIGLNLPMQDFKNAFAPESAAPSSEAQLKLATIEPQQDAGNSNTEKTAGGATAKPEPPATADIQEQAMQAVEKENQTPEATKAAAYAKAEKAGKEKQLAFEMAKKEKQAAQATPKANEIIANMTNAPAASVVAPTPSAAAVAGAAAPAEDDISAADVKTRGLSLMPAGRRPLAMAKALPQSVPMQGYDALHSQYQDQGRDKFTDTPPNPLKLTKDEPVSTFSIDVDTASYSFVRSALNQNVLPQKNAVRVEEMINYFPYDYSPASNPEHPFKASVSVFPTPWNKDTKLLHIGIKGYQLPASAKPKANLVFLIDTSGSMNAPNKLPLVQNALKLLVDTLGPEDSVAIVTYAGNAGVALEPTKIKEKTKILGIIDNLAAAGSTAGAEGIRQAYQLAEQNIDPKGVNRVILATDGDFNVGITDVNELKSFIESKRATGVSLSVLGFGAGNYNDQMMQTLAQNGNGNAAYIDTLNEARKALVEEAGSTLFTIAKDVKIQVEFNPAQVAGYRLIGYETRLLKTEDFNNDKVDAGDIGSGHTVTALYEITPVASKAKLVDDLRYQQQAAKPMEASGKGDEYAFVKIRYKLPNSDDSKLITTPVNAGQEYKSLPEVPAESRFATAVAAFGQLLRGGVYLKNFGFDDVMALAQGAKGDDNFGYRAEFINLVRLAKNAPALPSLGQ